MRPVLQAGLVAAAVSGAPSTLIALARGDDPLDGARAAGQLLLGPERHTLPLLLAAAPLHLALSLGWAVVLERALPPGRELAGGAAGGLAIAALDLGLIGRRLPAIRRLPQGRQWADHIAYGLAVGAILARRRARSDPAPRQPTGAGGSMAGSVPGSPGVMQCQRSAVVAQHLRRFAARHQTEESPTWQPEP